MDWVRYGAEFRLNDSWVMSFICNPFSIHKPYSRFHQRLPLPVGSQTLRSQTIWVWREEFFNSGFVRSFHFRTIMKSTPLDHVMKIELLGKTKQLTDVDYHYWTKQFKNCFPNRWIAKIKEDKDLKKFFEHYQLCSKIGGHRWLGHRWRPNPVCFIRSLFRHFLENCMNIKKTRSLNIGGEEKLLERLESKLGNFCEKLRSKIRRRLQKLGASLRKEFDFYLK
ncbi:hypothetical protein PTKIN_Ptkin01aG0327000 [Pterospermum kingtungense]